MGNQVARLLEGFSVMRKLVLQNNLTENEVLEEALSLPKGTTLFEFNELGSLRAAPVLILRNIAKYLESRNINLDKPYSLLIIMRALYSTKNIKEQDADYTSSRISKMVV